MERVVGQTDALDQGAALGGKTGAFHVQILDQGNGVAFLQHGTVGVNGRYAVVIFVSNTSFSPGLGFVFHVHHVQQILSPHFTLAGECFQLAPCHHLHRRHLAPHAVAQATPVVDHQGIRLFQLTTAGVTDSNAVIIVAGGGVRHHEGGQRLLGAAQFTLGARARLQNGVDGHVVGPIASVKRPALGGARERGGGI